METQIILNGKSFTLSIEQGSGNWHDPIYFGESPYETIRLEESITGCGLYLMKGFTSFYRLNRKDLVKVFKEHIVPFIVRYSDHPGAVIATLGEDFYNEGFIEEFLEPCGFICIHEYHNWRHGSNYKQKIFVFDLPRA